ncbi:MAG: TRAP transporter large permease subunit, partial [Bauldia litoralis]
AFATLSGSSMGSTALLGTLAELDIGKLLIAGILPGLILAVMYAILIFVRATLDPEAAPSYDVDYVTWRQRLLLFLLDVLPMISIIVMVIMLIMLGIATPSESAAYGSVGVILLALLYLLIAPVVRGLYLRSRGGDPEAARASFAQARRFPANFGRATWKSLWGAARVTTIALLILFGSSLFSNVLATSGASNALINWVAGFDVSGYVMLLIMFGILLLLGMFMDQFAMMLLTVPIFFPIVKGLDFGMTMDVKLIWFGIIMLLAMEISFTTPPFGLLLFVMQGVCPPGTKFLEICMAAIPFMACAMLLVALIIIFPGIATWLPFLGG